MAINVLLGMAPAGVGGTPLLKSGLRMVTALVNHAPRTVAPRHLPMVQIGVRG